MPALLCEQSMLIIIDRIMSVAVAPLNNDSNKHFMVITQINMC